MIAASNAAAVFARLIGRARRIAEAEGASRSLARQEAPRRWRRASLLWPLFTKG